jgi:hypothetical protein
VVSFHHAEKIRASIALVKPERFVRKVSSRKLCTTARLWVMKHTRLLVSGKKKSVDFSK